MATIVKAAEPRKTSNHFGVIGDRIRIEGVIRRMVGNKPVMHIIEDIDGNLFVLRRNSALGSKPGVLVTIEADVLEHRTYQDIKQTVVSAGRQEIVTDQHAFRREG
jgi:hypothetical protein